MHPLQRRAAQAPRRPRREGVDRGGDHEPHHHERHQCRPARRESLLCSPAADEALFGTALTRSHPSAAAAAAGSIFLLLLSFQPLPTVLPITAVPTAAHVSASAASCSRR